MDVLVVVMVRWWWWQFCGVSTPQELDLTNVTNLIRIWASDTFSSNCPKTRVETRL